MNRPDNTQMIWNKIWSDLSVDEEFVLGEMYSSAFLFHIPATPMFGSACCVGTTTSCSVHMANDYRYIKRELYMAQIHNYIERELYMDQIYNLSWSTNISKQFSFNAALYPQWPYRLSRTSTSSFTQLLSSASEWLKWWWWIIWTTVTNYTDADDIL